MTSVARSKSSVFRERLKGKEPLQGSFVKTPTVHAIEIFGILGFDFAVIDAEHAPIDRGAIDHMVLAARSEDIAPLVRIASSDPHHILSALDVGAAGVVVPHVWSDDIARSIVKAGRYRKGRRGFSNSPRAGGYGSAAMWDHVDQSDNNVSLIAQIEDPEALDHIDAILAIDEIDAIFLGRADLAVALGASSAVAPEVHDVCARVCDAARRASKPIIAFVGTPSDAKAMKDLGVTGFVISSDQGFLRQAAGRALQEYSNIVAGE